jgi:A/G-specific adenine glycosylase
LPPQSSPSLVPDDRHLAAFRNDLLAWYRKVGRDVSWRNRVDPYSVWVAETLLQQTRVDQATPYYDRFIARFPTVDALAAASVDDVLRAWEGLGYYARARNLRRAAQIVVEQYDGVIPNTLERLCALPGVGPYTASAILAIAFGQPAAAVDGNVTRVVSRVFSIGLRADTAAARRLVHDLATRLISPDQPGLFTHAIMELGAMVCRPRTPHCELCPLRPVCSAAASGTPEAFPVRAPGRPTPHYDVAVAIIEDGSGHVLIQRRPEDGLLGGLWEFPGGKRVAGETLWDACRREMREELQVAVTILAHLDAIDHAYSHFRVTLHPFLCRITGGIPTPPEGVVVRWVPEESLTEYPFPRANRRLIDALVSGRSRPD